MQKATIPMNYEMFPTARIPKTAIKKNCPGLDFDFHKRFSEI